MIFVGNFTKREQIVILIFVVLVLVIFGYEFYIKKDIELIKADTKNEIMKEDNIEIATIEDDISSKENIAKKILVHIDGEIVNPGVIELTEGARIIDAVNIAGGLTQFADEKRINLAKKVSDEEKIYIPRIGEDISEVDIISTNQANSVSSNKGKVNINTASKEELQSLPGIGPALAEKIIEYRQNRKFSNIDDIKNVAGIGEKRFESIKDFIIVK